MPTREEMQSLGQTIVCAYDDRVKRIAELQTLVSEELTAFDNAEKVVRSNLRADFAKEDEQLARNEEERRREFKPVKRELHKGVTQRKMAVSSQLAGFDNAEKVVRSKLRADFAKEDEQLARSEKEREREFKPVKRELQKGVTQRKTAVSSQLVGFDAAHKRMSDTLRAQLAKDFADRKKAVADQMKELAAIRAGGHTEWHRLTTTMQTKRGAAMPKGAAPPAAPVPAPEELVTAGAYV